MKITILSPMGARPSSLMGNLATASKAITSLKAPTSTEAKEITVTHKAAMDNLKAIVSMKAKENMANPKAAGTKENMDSPKVVMDSLRVVMDSLKVVTDSLKDKASTVATEALINTPAAILKEATDSPSIMTSRRTMDSLKEEGNNHMTIRPLMTLLPSTFKDSKL